MNTAGKALLGGLLGLVAFAAAYGTLMVGSPYLKTLLNDGRLRLWSLSLGLFFLVLLFAFFGSKVKSAYYTYVYIYVVLVAVLYFGEAYLFANGHKPGFYLEFSYLQREDSFALTNQFVGDSIGITKANKNYYELHEPDVYINQDGFRSREFTDTCPGRKRILLLGDSFVWGSTAKPINQSFADLLNQDYCAYNTGIIGADPLQYEAIARTYMPILKPHLTCLFLFVKNDILLHDIKLRPYVPNHFWAKNMGVSSIYIKEGCELVYFDNADTAYRFYLDNFSLFTREDVMSKALSATNLGTFLYFLANKPHEAMSVCEDYVAKPITRDYLLSVQNLAEENGSEFLLFLIPDKLKLPHSLDELYAMYPRQFDGLTDIHLMTDLNTDDYEGGGDCHFNNQGHARYAKYVRATIEQELP